MKKALLIFAFLFVSCGFVFGDAMLVLDGKSNYDIVIRKDAPRVTQYAASELQSQIKKTTGVLLPIANGKGKNRHAIYIGSHGELPSGQLFKSETYAEERFRVAELPDGDLSIMGADSEIEPLSANRGNLGLLFGVYEFIERFLGTRWYAPGELGECIDPKTTITVTGLPIDQKPHCWGRSYWPLFWIETSKKDSFIFNRRLRAFGLRAVKRRVLQYGQPIFLANRIRDLP